MPIKQVMCAACDALVWSKKWNDHQKKHIQIYKDLNLQMQSKAIKQLKIIEYALFNNHYVEYRLTKGIEINK